MRGLGRGPRKGEWGAGHSHTGVGLLLGEVTGQAQVGDAHVAMLIQQDIGGLWRKPRTAYRAAQDRTRPGRMPVGSLSAPETLGICRQGPSPTLHHLNPENGLVGGRR